VRQLPVPDNLEEVVQRLEAKVPVIHAPPTVEPPDNQLEEQSVSPVRQTGRLVRVRVRAYTPYDDIDADSPFRDGLTSIGRNTATFPNQWGIAADPRIFPYGTLIVVPGYKPSSHFEDGTAWPVDDTGGRIRTIGGQYLRGQNVLPLIEVRFIHQRSARRWGERVLDVLVFDS